MLLSILSEIFFFFFWEGIEAFFFQLNCAYSSESALFIKHFPMTLIVIGACDFHSPLYPLWVQSESQSFLSGLGTSRASGFHFCLPEDIAIWCPISTSNLACSKPNLSFPPNARPSFHPISQSVNSSALFFSVLDIWMVSSFFCLCITTL